MVNSDNSKSKMMDLSLALPSILGIIAFAVYVVVNTESADRMMNAIFTFCTGIMGSFYLYLTLGFFFLALWFAFGKYGNKTFGDEKPEFSTPAWLSMIYVSSGSAGLLYWATIEFYYYVMWPPFGAEPLSVEAYQWATVYGPYHWGFLPYSMYAAAGVLFGFVVFVQKKEVLRPSTACVNVIGEKNVNGWLGKVIDALFVIAFITGMGTSIGIAAPLVASLASTIFGLEHTIMVDAAVLIMLTLVFTVTVYVGLHKGMKLMANVRVWLTLAFLAFLIIVGPRAFMLNNAAEMLGTMFHNFFRMSLYTDPHGQSGFPQGWTIFYWAFYLAFILQLGLFYARISKGRTVRQFVIGMTSAGAVSAMIFFWTLGNYSMDIFRKGTVPVHDLIEAGALPVEAIVQIWATLPFPIVTLPFLLFLSFLFAWTMIQGGAYTLAMVTQKNITGKEEPSNFSKIFWCIALGVFALSLLYLGGLETIKTSTIAGSVPTIFIMSMVVVSVLKDMRKVWGDGGTEKLPRN